MALSLHAEYLLGYLAGAKNLSPRDVVPFARLDPADKSAQGRALVKALALGVTDGRKGVPVRDASEVRIRVLALLGPAQPSGTTTGEHEAGVRESHPQLRVEEILARVAESG